MLTTGCSGSEFNAESIDSTEDRVLGQEKEKAKGQPAVPADQDGGISAAPASLWADGEPFEDDEPAPAAPRQAQAPAGWGGGCDNEFPAVATTGQFGRLIHRMYRARRHDRHRVHDTLVPADADGWNVEATAETGILAKIQTDTILPFGKGLLNEPVELWVRTCTTERVFGQKSHGWEKLGTAVTGKRGFARFALPARTLPKGDYKIRVRMSANGTFAEGTLAIWPRGTKAIAVDIDGTVNHGNQAFFAESANLMPTHLTNAPQLFQLYTDRGYKVVYLTGRPQRVAVHTCEFLDTNGFPRGFTIFASESFRHQVADEIPIDQGPGPFDKLGIGLFKFEEMQKLAEKGVEWHAGYGDMKSDAWAYFKAGVPREQVWIRGSNHEEQVTFPAADGRRQTQQVSSAGREQDYASHLEFLQGNDRRRQPRLPLANQ